jgi:hypothetical protein
MTAQILLGLSAHRWRSQMKTKTFDAVKAMREIRDKMSRKYARMTPEDEIADLQKRVPHVPRKKQETSRKRSAVKGRE